MASSIDMSGTKSNSIMKVQSFDMEKGAGRRTKKKGLGTRNIANEAKAIEQRRNSKKSKGVSTLQQQLSGDGRNTGGPQSARRPKFYK
eukprot:SAG31_NODE_155_length_22130_cov_9.540098_29_plen_88_part_00